ncbi:MAG TPA: DUF1772 domain-containing protein [Cyclobacteriaceae bacterium]|nr:DUF1772 domain-containing protein [Cyclobacteriaceae bacterium]
MNTRITIVRFLNILIVSVLAGVSLGIWIGFNPMHLTVQTYIEQQQNMLRSLRVLMVTLVFLATILTLISAFMQRKNKSTFASLLVASGFLVACILITRFGNKPIDDVVLTWASTSVPDNWTELRDSWWSLHITRTLTEIIALCLITWTAIKKTSD